MMSWVKVTCPTCGKYLGEVKKDTDIFCNKCGKWVNANEGDEDEWGKETSMTKES